MTQLNFVYQGPNFLNRASGFGRFDEGDELSSSFFTLTVLSGNAWLYFSMVDLSFMKEPR